MAWVSIRSLRYTFFTLLIWSMGVVSPSLANQDGPGAFEHRGVGHHDALPRLHALRDLHLGHADRADLDLPLYGHAVVHHVGQAAAPALQERAAGRLDHVRPALQHHAHAHALALAQAGGRLPVEHHRPPHLAVADLRGHRGHAPGIGLALVE